MWRARRAPHVLAFPATSANCRERSIYIHSSTINPFSFSPAHFLPSFQTSLSDISLRHLSKISFSILPLSGILSFFSDGPAISENKNNWILQTTTCHLWQRFWGFPDDHAHAELRSESGPTCCWLPGSLRSLLLSPHSLCLGCQVEKCTLESKKYVQANRCLKAAEEGANVSSGYKTKVGHSGQFWDPSQLLWGLQSSQNWWVLHEETESRLHPVHHWAITQAWSPVTSQPRLHLGLTRRILRQTGQRRMR